MIQHLNPKGNFAANLFTFPAIWGKMTHKGGVLMFRRKDEKLWQLQKELLAVEEDYEEDYEEEFEEQDYEDCFDSDYEEEYEQEAYRPHHINHYKKGNPKTFDDDDFFEDGFDDEDVLYQKDYKKAKRKKRRKTFGLLILAIAELAAICAILLWLASWLK